MQASTDPTATGAPAGQPDPAAGDAANGAVESTDTEPLTEVLLDSWLYDSLPEWARAALDFLGDFPFAVIPVLALVGWLAGKVLQAVLAVIGNRLARHTRTSLDDQLLKVARRPAMTTPLILALMLATLIMALPDGVHRFTMGVLATLLLLSWLRAALSAAHLLLEVIANRKGSNDYIQARTIPLFEITARVLLVALAGYLFLLIWGIDPTAWLASAGVIGIAVGFAARDTLANLFSGVFIVADAPYKIGDYIVLDTGERGEVTHVGMRSTRLLTRDDIEITIPNAIIANAKIINESGGPWEKHRIRVPVGVAYGTDADEVERILEDIAKEHPAVLDDPAPRVRMRAFGPSSVNFELLGWIDRPVQRGLVSHELHKAVYKRFNAEGIRIPFPQQDLWVRSLPGQE